MCTGRAPCLLSVLDPDCLYWQLPHVQPHTDLQNSRYLLNLVFKLRPTELHGMPGFIGTAEDLQKSNSHSVKVCDRHPRQHHRDWDFLPVCHWQVPSVRGIRHQMPSERQGLSLLCLTAAALHEHKAHHTGVFIHIYNDTVKEQTNHFHIVAGYILSSRTTSSQHSNDPSKNSAENGKGVQQEPR